MLKRVLGTAIAIAAVLAPAAHAAPKDEPKTARVEHVKTLPAPAGIGANFKGNHMFVTGTSGLFVYDISDGDNPTPVGSLPLPHYENEDVSIGGNRLLISGDGTLGGGLLHVIDISNPSVPRLERTIKLGTLGGAGHTATCIQECKYVWVAGGDSISVLDLTKLDQVPATGATPGVQVQSAASEVEAGDLPPVKEFGWGTHDVQVDEAGYAWVVGGDGTVAFDVREGQYPAPGATGKAALLQPKLVARTGSAALNDGDAFDDPAAPDPENSKDTLNDFIHHNSWRPDAAGFESRRDAQTPKSDVRDGELVLITEEDIWSRVTASATPGGCETQGSFQTWQVKQFSSPTEAQSTVQNRDSWTTDFNEAIKGDDDPYGRDIVPTKGFCSSHYFSERDDIVATAWYEQGTRFLDVSDPRNITEVGYFIAPGSTTWATYWSPTDENVLYVVDNNRGVDVLRFDRGDVDRKKAAGQSAEVKAPLAEWWFDASTTEATPHPEFGWVCRLPL